MFSWWWPMVFLICIHGYRAQQSYVNNKQLDCDNNHTTALGFTCNSLATDSTCRSYLTFRPQPPLYNTPANIASLLNSNPDDINASSNAATITANTVVVVPIRNCSCSGGQFYQHNASYQLSSTDETYFTIANNTYEGLTTCQAMIAQNPYNYRDLVVGNNITVPLRCACPTANQRAAGIRFLLTYLVTWGDSYESMSKIFDNVSVQSILDANELNVSDIIFPFTPILIPLTTEPTTTIITPATPATPPTSPVIPVTPGTGGSSSSKWVFVGVGIGVGLLLLVSLSGFLVWFFRKKKIQHKNNLLPPKHSPNTHQTSLTIPPESKSWSMSSQGIRFAIESLTVYKYHELQKATGDFSEENRIKGSVYRGIFNGDSAAVKMMKGDVSSEINILQHINHLNIIRLSGFCLHQGNTYLVYEFANNGSLSDWMHSATKNTKYESVLGWKERVQIAHDIADALNYLHNFVTPPYIHKNLKSSNVLIDSHMRAKITNFGLARTVDEDLDGELQLTRHVVGTFGYMPPEYIENGLITPKMDVFALGVLISELLSGKEAATRPPEAVGDKEDTDNDTAADLAAPQQGQLSEMIKEVVGGDHVRDKLTEFMDSKLRGEYPVELAYSAAELASKCVAADLNDRPSVAEVFVTLSKIRLSSLDWDPSDELEHSRSLSHGR
ncbi:protein LYK5 [Cynara cardunculus var. scolymus]|uniref:Concanavalin A-like lectin/glucanase, subgroup n=1 Tax=Cynara cardunculus var. scolymus TaxID=59895 RepID=A0A118K2Y7_CYNCS|nr:protein LYK5 [Cynara cardunculus var. scolymus]KVI05117.1 Concanavalin A-like lectin/glucanase, subgroup [Cynara cardunculus var. scolymus]